MKKSASVYRHFDGAGVLLYVGASSSVKIRNQTHATQATWYDQVRTITIEPMPCLESALKAESAAIKEEKPRYNVAGKRRPMPKIPEKKDCKKPYRFDEQYLKKMAPEQKKNIADCDLDSPKAAELFRVNAQTIQFLRGQDIEYEIDMRNYRKRMEKYLADQEKMAREEMAAEMEGRS